MVCDALFLGLIFFGSCNIVCSYNWRHPYGEKLQFVPEGTEEEFPFRNVTLPWKDRINDLVSRLTLDEVILQLSRGGANTNGPAPAIDRLGIKPYNWNTECLRGYGLRGEATCFPQPIGLAATFDGYLIKTMSQAVAKEARAKHNQYNKEGNYGDHTGLSCFAPVINIMRHPLWGRNQETYGEDPVLTSLMAEAYVTGLYGGIAEYPAATAVCKHFDVHGGPENIPTSRFGFNAVVSDHDWGTTFLPAFRSCLKAGAEGVMCSYNAINGVPSCANKKLLTDILRNNFKFEGYVVSDEGAIEHIDTFFHYTKTPLDTAVAAKNAGVDLELAVMKAVARFNLLTEAHAAGRVSEENLRDSAKILFLTRMKLGEFDPPEMVSWNSVTMDVVQSKAHRDLAKTIAAKSFVLLKNDGVLPLKSTSYKKIAVIGPFGNNSAAVTGDYYTDYDLKYFSSPADYFANISKEFAIAAGCVGSWDENLPRCLLYKQEDVKKAVTGADLVVVTVGTGRGVEAEGRDRSNMTLPGHQLQMLQDAVQFAAGVPVLLLTFNAGPVDLTWAVESSKVGAILACHFPAQSTGDAIGMVVSGMVNPGGRLPYTWPASMDQVPPMTNYSMHERTYRYSTSKPLFPFGYGMSYTTFKYINTTAYFKTINVCNSFDMDMQVENTGDVAGDEVIQMYHVSHDSTVPSPIRQLGGFSRVHIDAHQTYNILMQAQAASRAVWKNGDYYDEPGNYTLYVGGQQPHQELKLPSNILEIKYQVVGTAARLSDCEV